MLIRDSFAALCTLSVLTLLVTGQLELWHLYVLNALNGLGNTFQQPASDVAVSLLTPKAQYQRAAGMRTFSNSLVTILSPVIATALLGFLGMLGFLGIYAVMAFDLLTFVTAFTALAFFIRIPDTRRQSRDAQTGAPAVADRPEESVLQSALAGLD